MTSARRVGTSESVSTYGASGMGRDYTSLAVWEAATDNDLVTAQVSEVLECYDDAVFDDTVLTFGATTDTDYLRIIRPAGVRGEASWQGHGGTPNTGVRFNSPTLAIAYVFSLREPNFQLQDIAVTFTAISASGRHGILVDSSAINVAVVGCIAHNCINIGAGYASGFQIGGTATGTRFIDCLAIGNGHYGFYDVNANVSYFYNCTASDNVQVGFKANSASSVAKNCIASGNSLDDFDSGFDAASTNNASSDATAPGTSPRTSQTFTFLDAGSDDYHLDPSDLGALGYGTDLSADATYPFDDDIDGETITTWSIGADAQAAVALALSSRRFRTPSFHRSYA